KFTVGGNYGVPVVNDVDSSIGQLFMSIYWEFGSDNYANLVSQNYFTIAVYDIYGNTGEFNPDFSLIPSLYNKDDMSSIHPFNSGPATSNNFESYDDHPLINLVSNYNGAGEYRYVCFTEGEYDPDHVTYPAYVGQKVNYSRFLLEYQGGKAYLFRFNAWKEFA